MVVHPSNQIVTNDIRVDLTLDIVNDSRKKVYLWTGLMAYHNMEPTSLVCPMISCDSRLCPGLKEDIKPMNWAWAFYVSGLGLLN